MKRPLIGITSSQETSRSLIDYDTLSAAYSHAISEAGGSPLLIPTDFPLDALEDLLSRLDGLLLSGGGDIEPSRFKGKHHPRVSAVSVQRDEIEIRLTQLAVEKERPLLGICRGMQVMNVALGGTLYTNVPTQFPSKLDHNTPLDQGRDFLAHEVTIEAGSRLASIIEKPQIKTNSFHHQAAREIAPSLIITAHASDGLVEAIEYPKHRFFIGVQWHPECMQKHGEQQKLFQAFIQAAQSA